MCKAQVFKILFSFFFPHYLQLYPLLPHYYFNFFSICHAFLIQHNITLIFLQLFDEYYLQIKQLIMAISLKILEVQFFVPYYLRIQYFNLFILIFIINFNHYYFYLSFNNHFILLFLYHLLN